MLGGELLIDRTYSYVILFNHSDFLLSMIHIVSPFDHRIDNFRRGNLTID